MLRRFVHGPGVDEPIIWFEGSTTTSPRYYVQNYQGSVIGYTDASGNLTEMYKYGPYGEPLVGQSPLINFAGSRFRYTGQTTLPEASLYYYKARVYDPVFGRFLQTDPIGSKDDLDLYDYTGDDPVNKTDSTGLAPCESRPCPREVHDNQGGTVTTRGWQNPNHHTGAHAGLGYRVWVTHPDGSRTGYGHLEPNATMTNVGDHVNPGGTVGEYANPTNGHSTGAHVHVQQNDSQGHLADPGRNSPLHGPSHVTTPYAQVDGSHPHPHQGTDWVANQNRQQNGAQQHQHANPSPQDRGPDYSNWVLGL